ncbi:hypothetical protein GDO81_023877 [Engystomops pustulosus]|uniref:HhH-GPD domain-containing protein n=1 Tax=Engystomops pustulosus TaxID=76066 RepID=A0AAV6ZXZ1_ENGPU|nr:hypothetical protein GDO81_023877 [Engystomops pustulosus]
MASASGLFQCSDPKTWKRVSDMYWEVVAAKGAKQKKLLELDRWYQEELPALIGARPHKSLTSEEMVKLMEWKLTRGKFRPRLKQLVSSNAASTVESCTRKAFQLLPDVSAAIEELCQLKGIGPATASASEEAWTPHRVELCLWTWKVAEKHCPELLESLGDEKERPAKKLKTKQ